MIRSQIRLRSTASLLANTFLKQKEIRLQKYVQRYNHSNQQKPASDVIPHASDTPDAPVNINHFKALFQPARGKLEHKRYKLRWDWHLRNLLYSLVPAAVVYILLTLADHLIIRKYDAKEVLSTVLIEDKEDPDNSKTMKDIVMESKNGNTDEKTKSPSLAYIVRKIECRIEKLEKILEQQQERDEEKAKKPENSNTTTSKLEQESLLLKVKDIAKLMARHNSAKS